MNPFRQTTHLSEILEESNLQTVVIFKYSSECGSSSRLKDKLEKSIFKKEIVSPVYLVTVQEKPALSKKISEMFDIKHETPQILEVNKGKLIYTAHHNDIKIENLFSK